MRTRLLHLLHPQLAHAIDLLADLLAHLADVFFDLRAALEGAGVYDVFQQLGAIMEGNLVNWVSGCSLASCAKATYNTPRIRKQVALDECDDRLSHIMGVVEEDAPGIGVFLLRYQALCNAIGHVYEHSVLELVS